MAGGIESFSDTLFIDSADVATTTYTLKFGFKPLALRITASGRSTAGVGRATHRRGVGYGVSTTQRACYASQAEDSQSTSDTDRGMRNDAVFAMLNIAGAFEGVLDIDAVLDDGVRFILDQSFGADTLLLVQAWGGEAITKAEVGIFQMADVLGVQVVSLADATLTPAVCFFASDGSSSATFPRSNADARGCVSGVMVAATEQGYQSNADDSAVATTESYAATHQGLEAHMRLNVSGAEKARFKFSAFAAGSFSIDATEADNDRVLYMVIEGGNWAVRQFSTRTDGADIQAATGLSFRPGGAIFWSSHAAEDAPNTSHSTDSWSDGHFCSRNQQRVVTTRSEDAVATSNVTTSLSEDGVYERTNSSNVSTAKMSVKQVENDGLVCVMDDPDTAVSFVTCLLYGPDTERPALLGPFFREEAA